jgi:hypothetical protein
LADKTESARSEVLGSEFLPVPLQDRSGELASPEDMAAFQDRFMRLLEHRTAIYTMGDSSSVPTHVAVDLLRSVCFVLGIDPDDTTVPPELLSVDLEAEFRRRLGEMERKVELTGKLWQDACASMPAIPNISLHDTLATIGDFPKVYDFRSMAHEIPISFDYQLCHPVSEELLGVDYINEYLRHVVIENDFLGRFEVKTCKRLLSASSPDYEGLLINLYEPIAANAIGLALVGKDPHRLKVSDDDRAEIVRRLGALEHAARKRVLREAAGAVCESLGIRDEAARKYLAGWAAELLPRIEVGLPGQELRGVFVAF